jgi:hypothetical protein
MRIVRHDKCHVVELADGSRWRIWPADFTDTLQWLPTSEIDVIKAAGVSETLCSHMLVNRSDGSRVRVVDADTRWPIETVREVLKDG